MTLHSSRVRLLENVPFDLSYEHTRWFTSITEQQNYFTQFVGSLEQPLSLKYIRVERGEIKLSIEQEKLKNVNYVEFQNGSDGKTYYAFVNDVKYGNQNMAIIEFEIDVIQTYMFDLSFKQSFVEREHCRRWNADGTPVINTVPENIDIGNEYEQVSAITGGVGSWSALHKLLLITTTEPIGDDNLGLAISGSVATPLFHYLIMYNEYNGGTVAVNGTQVFNSNTAGGLFDIFTQLFDNEETANKVVGLNYLPFLPLPFTKVMGNASLSITSDYLSVVTIGTSKIVKVKAHKSHVIENILQAEDIFQFINFDGAITESKLMFYPYSLINIKDNMGKPFLLKPELNYSKQLQVDGYAVISTLQKVAYVVSSYKGGGSDFDKALVRDFNTDVPIKNEYTATYMQGNKNSLISGTAFGVIGGGVSVGLGLASTSTGVGAGIGASMIAGGSMSILKSIGGTISKVEDIKNTADSSTGQGGFSTLNIGFSNFNLVGDVMRIRMEKLLMVQKYFQMFGYAVNTFKVPNLRTRNAFNYVKTIGANITGKIPKDNLLKLKQIFDKGITLWHTNDMFVFDQQNNERS